MWTISSNCMYSHFWYKYIYIFLFFFLKNSFITLPFLIFSYLLLHLILLLSFSVLPPFFLNHGQYACLPTLISQLPVHLPIRFTVTVLLFHSATCSLSLISCLTYTGKMKIIFHLFQKGFQGRDKRLFQLSVIQSICPHP